MLDGGNQSTEIAFAVCRPSNVLVVPSVNRTILASHGFYTTAEINTKCITEYEWSFHCKTGPLDPNCNHGDDTYKPILLGGVLALSLDTPSLEIPPRAFAVGEYVIRNYIRIRGVSVFNVTIRFVF